ncbi:bestrophin family protein [Eudoraea chungangensis]|uniref:bestrophin family protein n=1 Tax=Eudoraea chungangensis TaxID=1481905 RepID=UPI0023ECCBE6|nr:bestrophin family ion channel [Eudoraea chungangensis]
MILEKSIPIRYWAKEVRWDLLIVMFFSLGVYFFKLYVVNIDVPIAIGTFLGTAIALLLSFKLAQSYDRWWEARKIWGSIVNDSRSLVLQVKSFAEDPSNSILSKMSYRQIAWCYALGQYLRKVEITSMIKDFIAPDEFHSISKKQHIPLALLDLQSEDLRQLSKNIQLNAYQQVQIDSTLVRLTASMGKAERIKNTVFPRTYRNVLHFFIYIFLGLLSLSLEDIYGFLEIPLLVLISIPFFMLEKIAFTIQDPFENRPTDTAMTSIARAIEINIKEILNEEELPKPLEPKRFYIM